MVDAVHLKIELYLFVLIKFAIDINRDAIARDFCAIAARLGSKERNPVATATRLKHSSTNWGPTLMKEE